MNVLILTPDRVGSNFLQSVLTIQMISSNQFNKPVINIRELTNGITEYFNPLFNSMVLKKDIDYNYNQSLEDIINLLKSSASDAYYISRIAHYHLNRRNDDNLSKMKFFSYLNDNNFIISARRDSLFEQCLSWGIVAHTKELNVYDITGKMQYANLINNPITIEREYLRKKCDVYKQYINWSNDNFDIQQIYTYEKDMPNIESFINNLNFMKEYKTFKEVFGMEWHDWNKCHRLTSDLSFVSSQKAITNVPSKFDISLFNNFPVTESKFLKEHSLNYLKTKNKISKLVDDGFLLDGIPIKLQTLVEKKRMIKNFNACLLWYNEWANENDFPLVNDVNELIKMSNKELKYWYNTINISTLQKLT